MKKPNAHSPVVFQSESHKRSRRLAKLLEDPVFHEHIQSIGAKIRGGQSLGEIRFSMKKMSNNRWNDMLHYFAHNYMNRDTMFLEFLIKSRGKAAMLAKSYKMAENKDDYEEMGKQTMYIHKVDMDELEMKISLGLLKPVESEETGGVGYSSIDNEQIEEKFKKELDERILKKLALQRELEEAEPIDVLDGSKYVGSSDRVGQASLVTEDTSGQQPSNPNPESQPDGSIDGSNSLVPMVVKDQAST